MAKKVNPCSTCSAQLRCMWDFPANELPTTLECTCPCGYTIWTYAGTNGCMRYTTIIHCYGCNEAIPILGKGSIKAREKFYAGRQASKK